MIGDRLQARAPGIGHRCCRVPWFATEVGCESMWRSSLARRRNRHCCGHPVRMHPRVSGPERVVQTAIALNLWDHATVAEGTATGRAVDLVYYCGTCQLLTVVNAMGASYLVRAGIWTLFRVMSVGTAVRPLPSSISEGSICCCESKSWL